MDYKYNGVYDNFAAIEGIDGSGKTSILGMFKNNLKTLPVNLYPNLINDHITHKFETAPQIDGDLYKLIKSSLQKENRTLLDKMETLCLYIADHVNIGSKIEKSTSNIFHWCDRSIISTLVYQGMDFDTDYIYELTKELKLPKYIFYFDIIPEISMRRIVAIRQKETDTYEQIESLKRSRKRYLEILTNLQVNNDIQIFTIEASINSVSSHGEVYDIFFNHVLNIFMKRDCEQFVKDNELI